MFTLDPKHTSFNLFDDQIVQDVWHDKYSLPASEKTPQDTFWRVAKAIFKNDRAYEEEAAIAMCQGLIMPGGRVLTGAGTGMDVTLMNCYVNETVEDSIEGIAQACSNAMVTLSRFGGIGTDFSPLRPKGAHLNRVGLTAPGPLPFMDSFHHWAEAIQQAGHRRGAMMGTLICTHPDLLDFIEAKHTKGRLTNFNVSILITDEFMEAVRQDKEWAFHHTAPPANVNDPETVGGGKYDRTHYIYDRINARVLWDRILRSTYEYSEPGVIFIDRINNKNNLKNFETISCTNPCGEQPLPPHGTCNLGAVNLARMISNPFKHNARFNPELIRKAVRILVRFLDNVIDITSYPLPEQAAEERDKRRIGLGITGLADALAQLGIPYGSPRAVTASGAVMELIANEAYLASALLAKERGTFPIYDVKKFNIDFLYTLDNKTQDAVLTHGLRNGVLLTVAPTGTTSILLGNVSSGLEPVFAHQTKRQVFRKDKQKHEYISWGFSARFYWHCHDIRGEWENAHLPEYMVTADQVTPKQHVQMQAAIQRWVDASVSKTINCPPDISFEDFKSCYQEAYDTGCKGCTTYRPSEVRGAVLEKVVISNDGQIKEVTFPPTIEFPKLTPETFTKQTKRPDVIPGFTYKVVWPSLEAAVFVTFNEHNGKPWEIFIQSKDLRSVEWVTAVAVFGSMLLQSGIDPMLVASQMKQIQGAHDHQWIGKKSWPSLVAYIGHIAEEHFARYTPTSAPARATAELPNPVMDAKVLCPKCHGLVIFAEGCKKCTQCSWSTCG